MENRSDSDSSQILGDWDFLDAPPSEGIIMVSSVPTSPESGNAKSKPIETTVPEGKRVQKTSNVVGENKKEEERRGLPPWMDPSYEWGGGKWKEDGRKRSEEIPPFKEIMEALLRNSGEENEKSGPLPSVVEIFKSMGFMFP